MLSWGWNITSAGGNKFCWLTWPRQLVQGREQNGLKIVQIDPRLRPAGPFADEWVPIKPAGDLAFAAGDVPRADRSGFVDEEYLTRYTNAPYLVGDDGRILKQTIGEGDEAEDVAMVWDDDRQAAVMFTEATSPVLDGTFTVDSNSYTTGYRLFVEHLDEYTADWAADKCGIDASTIRRLAPSSAPTPTSAPPRSSTASMCRTVRSGSWRITWPSRSSVSRRCGR